VDPFDTPQLGHWLKRRAGEFDVIAVWKLDRISRSAIRLNNLIGWCIDHDKTLVSCSESIDIGTPVGRLIANVIGFLAEGELEAMRGRQRASRRKLRETARWPGGKPPYGYRVVDTGHGKRLEIDPDAYPVIRRIVDAVLDGQSLAGIAGALNAEGVVSPADHHRVCGGGEDTDSPWRTGPLKHLLTSPTIVGHSHLGGVTVRDDQGEPVLMADEPLVSSEERELIAAALAAAEQSPRTRSASAPLIGVLTCWFCEEPLTTTRQLKKLASGEKLYSYYRCPNNCTPLIPTETAEEHVERLLMDAFGDQQLTEQVWVPGDNNEKALKEAVRAVDELTALAGTMTSRTVKDRLQRQLDALDSRISELETKPTREGGYQQREIGETYRQAWETNEDHDYRRELLKRVGVEVRMGVHEGQLLSHPIRLGDRLD
jgi:hypothetical protein